MNVETDFQEVPQPWSRHPVFADRVRRFSDILQIWQVVVFANGNQRDAFLAKQDEVQSTPARIHSKRQGPYGSHPRHRFNGNKGRVRHGS
jgi:hypothetical protein